MNFITASAKIANNYKNALMTVFNKYHAKYSIIIEDDMMFSPDFLSYFRKTAFLLKDPTVWCISSWNDFGFKVRRNEKFFVLSTIFF